MTKNTQPLYKWNVEGHYYELITNPDGSIIIGPGGGGSATYISVKDFSAAGDGVKDDTVSIRLAIAAVNALGGGVVFFPKGNYLVSGIIDLPSGVSLMGVSKEAATIVRTTPVERVFTMRGNQSVQNLGFNARIALQPSGAGSNVNVINCKFTGGTQSIYIPEPISNWTIMACEFTGNTFGILTNTGNGASSDVRILGCGFHDTTQGDFIEINAGVNNWLIDGCTFRNNTQSGSTSGFGIGIAVGAKNVVVNACTFENIAGRGFHIEASSEAILSNCTFRNCGAAAYLGSPKADVVVLSSAVLRVSGCKFLASDAGYSNLAIYNAGSPTGGTVKVSDSVFVQKYIGVYVSADSCEFYGDASLPQGSRLGTGVSAPASTNTISSCTFRNLKYGIQWGYIAGGSHGGRAIKNTFINCDVGIGDAFDGSGNVLAGGGEIMEGNRFENCEQGIRIRAGGDMSRRDLAIINNVYRGCVYPQSITTTFAAGYVAVIYGNYNLAAATGIEFLDDNYQRPITRVLALPTASAAWRGRQVWVEGSAIQSEVAQLAIVSGCSTNGNIQIKLGTTTFNVPITTAAADGPAVAAVIRAFAFTGWTTSGSGSIVVFTDASKANRTDATYAANGTGVTGFISTTVQGNSVSSADVLYTCIKLGTASEMYGWIPTGKMSSAGTSSMSGTGAATTMVMPHGLGVVPNFFTAIAASADAGAAGIKFVTADATNLTVTFNTAPVTGSSNVLINWRAE